MANRVRIVKILSRIVFGILFVLSLLSALSSFYPGNFILPLFIGIIVLLISVRSIPRIIVAIGIIISLLGIIGYIFYPKEYSICSSIPGDDYCENKRCIGLPFQGVPSMMCLGVEPIRELPQLESCAKAGGKTVQFGSSCTDTCDQLHEAVCMEVLRMDCDCGLGKCWNGSQCQVNPSGMTRE